MQGSMKMGVAMGTLLLLASNAAADIVTYSGPLEATRTQFNSYTGGVALLEDFESFAGDDVVGDMPGNGARFAPEYPDGSAAPLPVVLDTPMAPSGSRWMANFGNGRPAFAAWVIRPDNEGDLIYAFGQVNAQGDWVRIEGFDADDELVVSVDAQAINDGCFAGFIVPDGVSKVVVTPLGNFDGFNGMDDVQVATTPIEPCAADLNCDGYIDFFDVSAFINAYSAMNPIADFTGDGIFNFFDVSAFLAQFTSGCH